MIIRYFLGFLVGFSSLYAAADGLALHPRSDEEALFLRRIAQFYEEKEYPLVQKEIREFIAQYSESPFWYELNGVLGDLLVNEGKYQEAIEAYQMVKDPVLQNRLSCNYLLALLQSGNTQLLVTTAKKILSEDVVLNDEVREKIYFFMGSSLYDLAMKEEEIAKKNGFALEAKEYFEKVQKQEYRFPSKERLAHLYSVLKDETTASKLYEELAESHPDKREKFLFQAALNQSCFDAQKALETFTQVCQIRGELAPEAALNRMILLFEKEQYADLLLIKDQMISLLDEKHLPFFNYFLGKSYFQLEDYPRCIEALKTYFFLKEGKGQEEKSAYLLFLSGAEKLEDVSLYSEAFTLFKEKYAEDPQLLKAQLVRALLFKKKNDFLSSLEDFHFLEEKTISEDKDLFLYEYGHLLFEMGQWEKSYANFNSLLSEFPKSSYNLSSAEYLIHLSLKLFDQASKEEQIQRKLQLVNDLKKVLSLNEISFPPEKRLDYLFLLSTHLYDLKQADEALLYLSPIVEKITDVELKAKATLLFAYLNQEKNGDPKLFCKLAEEALSLSNSLGKTADIHLALFNAYLSCEESEENLLKAADHLYEAYQLSCSSITKDNHLWLVQFLYNHVIQNDKNSEQFLSKALVLYPPLLITSSDPSKIVDPGFLETHILQYSDLLTRANEIDKKIQFLESLCSQYDFLPQLQWSLQGRTYFELAKSYELIGNVDLAKKFYEKVFLSAARYPFKAEAMLDYTRLVLSEIKDFTPSNPEIRISLGRLKSVALQKSVATEPIHLQAALEAIDLQCASEKENSPEKHLFLLNKMVESFMTQDDILSKQYHDALGQNPEKKKIFETYMSLVEAERIYWTSQIKQKDDPKALEGFYLLRQKEDHLSSYLIKRIDSKISSSEQIR